MKTELQKMINERRSVAEWESRYHNGLVNSKTWQTFQRVSLWLAPLFAGAPGAKHDAFYNSKGAAAYWRRINRHRVAFGLDPMKV
jgi:hypothetical protein